MRRVSERGKGIEGIVLLVFGMWWLEGGKVWIKYARKKYEKRKPFAIDIYIFCCCWINNESLIIKNWIFLFFSNKHAVTSAFKWSLLCCTTKNLLSFIFNWWAISLMMHDTQYSSANTHSHTVWMNVCVNFEMEIYSFGRSLKWFFFYIFNARKFFLFNLEQKREKLFYYSFIDRKYP